MRRIVLVIALLALAGGLAVAPRQLVSRPATSPEFSHFESAHVSPAAMTPNGSLLLVVNTPDNRLSVFSLAGASPVLVAEIPVGMEPVSVRAYDDTTAWVVNTLSDNVSIVDLKRRHTVETLPVGDGPSDVVFAGGKAYVSVTEEDRIRVFDPVTRAPLASIATGSRMPRTLARNASGTLVFAANLMAGNRTSVLGATEIPVDSMPEDFDLPMDPGLPPAPRQGLIIQEQAGTWYDMYGNVWNSKAKYTMPDRDVTEISTSSDVVTRSFAGLGSTMFGIAVSPLDGRLAVPTTEARNLLRFEPRLIGYLVETQIAWVSTAGALTLRKLDPHIDYDVLPGTQAELDSAIATPSAVAFSGDGLRAYVTAFGSDKLAVLNPAGGAFSTIRARVPTVGGPSGVVVDDARNRVYVVGRFRNQLQTLSTANFAQLAVTPIGMDPTPDAIVNGRRLFYAGSTSGHGDQSCASCHIYGDLDGLAWDLGDPFGVFVPPPVPNPQNLSGFHPMKGPLVTQTLRGMTNTEPFHWRGDRINLSAFNGAFVSLLGRTDLLPDSQMTSVNDFVLAMVMAPNPNQRLDRGFHDAPPGTPSSQRGRDFFLNTPVMNGRTCESCHDENNHGPGTNLQMVHRDSILESQDLKVPQLRNIYRKGGFTDQVSAVSVRGFGYAHDGSDDTPFRFLQRPQFSFDPNPTTADNQRRDMETYLLAFDTGMAPAVGYQVTFTGANNGDPVALGRVDTLRGQAALNYCDLIAKGRIETHPRGWIYQGGGLWKGDRISEADLTTAQLIALAADPHHAVTITGVPKGSGIRMGIDRDLDGWWDSDESRGGFDPANPASHPTSTGVPPEAERPLFTLGGLAPNPFRDGVNVSFTLARGARVDAAVFDVLGREVRTVARGRFIEAGAATLRWDGRNADGHGAPAGVYFVRVSIPEAGIQWTRPVVRIR